MFSHKKETAQKDRSNETPEQKQKRIKTSLLLSARRLLKNSDSILQSCHALFSGNLFPPNTTETEKAALKESLILLANRKKEAQSTYVLLGAMDPEEKQKRRDQKKRIHQEYHHALAAIDGQAKEQIGPVKNEKNEIEQELRRMKEEYLEKKRILVNRKKELTQQKKQSEKEQKGKHIAAANARAKALNEIERLQESETDTTRLVSAEQVIDFLKTDINRVKGSLMAIFASEDEEEKMNAILRGEFRVPQKTQLSESVQDPPQELDIEHEIEENLQNPKPISSEGSIPLSQEPQEDHQIAEGEAILDHQHS